MTTTSQIRVIRADDRHRWDSEWLTSHQSFPATGNFDLIGNAHGVLMVNNDDTVDAGEGFDTHQHADTEIVTWVVEGSLHHKDSRGHEGVLTPGVVQRMTAGTGIMHSERNASSRADNQRLRVVQMWVATEYAGATPGYAEADVSEALVSGELVPIVSGLDHHRGVAPVTLPNSYAALHAARMHAGGTVTLPAAPFGHLYVVDGTVDLSLDGEVTSLERGDAVQFTDATEQPVTATSDSATSDTEILYWEMHTGFPGH
ncbi:pirin family protein [Gordonia sp. VNQ95]|jgi:redox-sensitive bicupin YhaK (pirin superfamily)|uniref:pirin family protein n=1 Tax=Gordonia TaxID=2053 RepID=UPI0032B61043